MTSSSRPLTRGEFSAVAVLMTLIFGMTTLNISAEKYRARDTATRHAMRQVQTGAEQYCGIHGFYPRTLTDLLADRSAVPPQLNAKDALRWVIYLKPSSAASFTILGRSADGDTLPDRLGPNRH